MASDSPLYATAFSPDGKILAAAGAGRTVQLWDVSRTGRPVRLGTLTGPALIVTLTGAQGHVFSVAFSPSGRVLAAASNDGTAHPADQGDRVCPTLSGQRHPGRSCLRANA